MKTSTFPYWIIVTVSCTLWVPYLLAKGMFVDGIFDALFAHNLAQGISSFWAPQTIYYSQPAYWDNPPLSMYLLSLCYKAFGDSYVMERIYSLTCAIVQLLLIASAWRIYFSKDERMKNYTWLPCLLWLFSPLVGWCYSNNLMENTMSIFTTSAVIAFLLYMKQRENILMYAIIGGSLVFLAFLSKGPVGLFPLTVPLFFVWSERAFGKQKLFVYMFFQLIVCALIFALVFSMPEAKNFLVHYLNAQLVPALTHEMKERDAPFSILLELTISVLPLLILSVISFLGDWKKIQPSRQVFYKTAFAFLMIGFSASLPIVLSAKQHKYYLLPSLPMFSIGFSLLIFPLIERVKQRIAFVWNRKAETIAKTICAFVVLICLFFCIKNRYGFARDEQFLTDIEKIQPIFKNEKIIRADWSLFGEWSLRAYLNRFYDQKLCMPDEIAQTNFYMTKPGKWGDKLPENSQKVFSGKTFDVYQLQR